ncbi:MAG TPA: 4Fe-4S binding protein [Candidatus Methanoperedens sp.]
MKTGVFLCTCNRTIDIDFSRLEKGIGADVVEIHDALCNENGVSGINEFFKNHGPARALVACTLKKKLFESQGSDLSFVNLREHCGWVHERKEATEKARALVEAELHSLRRAGKNIIDVGKDVLVTGGISACMGIAKQLSKHGNVHVLISGEDMPHDTCDFDMLTESAGIKLQAGSLQNIEGRMGDFMVNIIRNPIDPEKCISCGLCLDACPINAISSYPMFAAGKNCDSCGKCVDICPGKAIDLNHAFKTLKAGQILAIGGFEKQQNVPLKKGIYVTDEGKTPQETLNLALPAAMEIISNMGRIEQDKLLTVSMEGCAGGKSGITGCRLCESICQHGAISRRGDNIVFDEISCQACGACASVCPLSLPVIEDDIYKKMEYLLGDTKLNRKILMFTCVHSIPLLNAAGRKKIKYPAVLPLFVQSIHAVSESHILRAFDLGADGVLMLGCKECARGKNASELAGIIMKEFGLDACIHVMDSDGIESFVKSVTVFSESLTPSPLRKHEPAVFDRTSKRHIMMQLISGFAASTGIVPRTVVGDSEYPFADITINSKCTVCGACTAMCPAGALMREKGSIKFIYGYCIACGLCERACPEKALKMRRLLDLSRLIDTMESTLFESKMMACAACKKPYMTEAAFDRIAGSLIVNVRDDIKTEKQVELIRSQVELLKYCEECRPVQAIKAGLFL